MRLFNLLRVIGLCTALAACQQTKDTATNAADTVGTETGASYNKMRELVGLGHPPPEPKQAAQPRYCYHTYNDVICYSRPLPGEEYRLAGYQEASGKTGYVIDPPVHHVVNVDSNDVKPSAAPTAPPLKSVTVGPPPKVAGVDGNTSQLKEVIFDPAELEPKELVPDKPQ